MGLTVQMESSNGDKIFRQLQKSKSRFLWFRVFKGGCCPGLRARDYKEPVLILEVVDGQRKSNRNDKEIRQQE